MDLNFGNLLLVLFFLMVMQVVGVHIQVKKYRSAVRRLHKAGNVGIGSKKRWFGAGSIVIIACNNEGIILGGEKMQGITIFAGFSEIKDIKGESIYSLLEKYYSMSDRERKFYKGHIQALEALRDRLLSGNDNNVDDADES